MEVRPIDANALLKRRRNFGKEYALDPVDKNIDDQLVDLRHVLNAPTLDYAPVKRGEWVDGMACQYCGQVDLSKPNYCPNCGARMKEDGKSENNLV